MDKYIIELPEFCLVSLIGGTSSGKSSFAAKHFRPTEILSSDFFRGMVCDDENDQSVSADAFDLLFDAADKRLTHMKLTVIDATNLQQHDRQKILELAKRQNVHTAAIVLDLPEKILQERNKTRTDRNIPARVIRQHCLAVGRAVRSLKKEGFRFVFVISSPEQLENTEIVRTKLWNDKKDEHGPFDIIGDVHGCCAELEALLGKLGYIRMEGRYFHPEGRKAAFLGDFCDRGPENADVLRLVMEMVRSGSAIAVPGNHDEKLLRYLKGKDVSLSHGLDKTITELEAIGPDFKAETAAFLDKLISHYVLDDGKLVISHAGIREAFIGRGSAAVRGFCLYGDTTGETDAYGLPVRLDWASDYRGSSLIVYGHVAGKEVRHLNNTVCIDTGCVYGGKLTAYRYPENEIVSISAERVYYEAEKPLGTAVPETDTEDILSVGDLNERMHILTDLFPAIDIDPKNAAAALEGMSRFADDPHWLIYLPPTMSPCETSTFDDYLEHPLEAFAYYRKWGVRHVVCEKKHMGSRAVIILCRSAETAGKRFGIKDGTRGIIYTRTGRRFFTESDVEKTLLDRLDMILTNSGFWTDFETDWVCLDAELMPWSEKAQGLIRTQYAAVGRAGLGGLSAAVRTLEMAAERENRPEKVARFVSGQNADPTSLLIRYRAKKEALERYIDAYREYCWNVKSVDDFRIAPFHILACEGKVFSSEKHVWHMEMIRKYITGTDPVFMETPFLCVDTENEESVRDGVNWWLSLTSEGGEGMVVKPETFIAVHDGKLLQPAVKCRGREYLRIIYGPEYLETDHLYRLKKRSLGHKRAMALREFALGMESLKRFVRKDPLYKVHECSFGVLALESEPVDPRL